MIFYNPCFVPLNRYRKWINLLSTDVLLNIEPILLRRCLSETFHPHTIPVQLDFILDEAIIIFTNLFRLKLYFTSFILSGFTTKTLKWKFLAFFETPQSSSAFEYLPDVKVYFDRSECYIMQNQGNLSTFVSVIETTVRILAIE